MSQCNYCCLREIKKDAKVNSKKVLIIGSKQGGLNVFVIPKDIKIDKEFTDKLRALRQSSDSEYFSAWFMSLGRHCEC